MAEEATYIMELGFWVFIFDNYSTTHCYDNEVALTATYIAFADITYEETHAKKSYKHTHIHKCTNPHIDRTTHPHT